MAYILLLNTEQINYSMTRFHYFQLSAIPEFMGGFLFLAWIFSASTIVFIYITFTVYKFYKYLNIYHMETSNEENTNANDIDV